MSRFSRSSSPAWSAASCGTSAPGCSGFRPVSSHALFGGLIGSAIAALGVAGVKWDGVVTSIIVPAVAAPVIAGARGRASAPGSIFAATNSDRRGRRDLGFRWGQIGSASLVSLAHGTNDAQKTMGVITLALIAYGSWTDTASIPVWVKISCAVAIALGTYVGGWRVIRTLGQGSGGDLPAPGHGGGGGQRSGHPVLFAPGHGPVDHPRGDRVDPRARAWAARARPCGGASPGGW